MNISKIFLFFLMLIISCRFVFSQNNIIDSENGLEVKNPNKVNYVISLENSSRHNIYESNIKTRTELLFRKYRINPVETYRAGQASDGLLHIMVTVYNNGFNVMLTYRRSVFFMVDDKFYFCNADTWSDGTSGTFGGNQDSITSAVAKYVEQFINNFLKANSSQW